MTHLPFSRHNILGWTYVYVTGEQFSNEFRLTQCVHVWVLVSILIFIFYLPSWLNSLALVSLYLCVCVHLRVFFLTFLLQCCFEVLEYTHIMRALSGRERDISWIYTVQFCHRMSNRCWFFISFFTLIATFIFCTDNIGKIPNNCIQCDASQHTRHTI